MSRFHFRLRPLLELRRATRDGRRAELARAYQAEGILQRRREELTDEIRRLRRRVRDEAAPGSVNVDALLGAHRYELLLEGEQALLRKRAEQLAAEIEHRRERLVEADRQVRILEKLRDKQFKRHQEQENKMEMKTIDEAAGRLVYREELEP